MNGICSACRRRCGSFMPFADLDCTFVESLAKAVAGKWRQSVSMSMTSASLIAIASASLASGFPAAATGMASSRQATTPGLAQAEANDGSATEVQQTDTSVEAADERQAQIQPHASRLEDEYADGEEAGTEIVVQGQRPRGSVTGNIPPENVLGPRDIRATGATSISELLDAVASQTGSARGRSGGMPILLLNGKRISSFRELRDVPPEAIERMEILPEEVALKYGYAADQRVVNIVMRRRFNSSSAELRGRGAMDGGHVAGLVDATRLIIANDTRTSLNFHAEVGSPLFESERDIALQPIPSQPEAVDPRPFRTLKGSSSSYRFSAVHGRTILGDVSATMNGEAERTVGTSRFGVPTGTLDDNGVEILRAFPEEGALARNSQTDALRAGTTLNWQKGKWQLSSTGNAELTHSVTKSDNGPDLSDVQDRIDAGDPTFDPLGDLGPLNDLPRDRSRSDSYSLSLDGTATGPLISLPAGDATATLRVATGSNGINSKSFVDGLTAESDLHRNSLLGSFNLDLPLTRRGSAIGRLAASANGSVSQLSDFGTITTLGTGLNWAPGKRLNLSVSWTREEGPPSLQQLGDPLIETPNVDVFDFATGQTVPVTTLTGGNRDLRADTRNVLKIGTHWQPFEKTELRLRGEYVRQTTDNPQAAITISEAIEAAFPARFVRDPSGNLTAVDLRPVNFQEARKSVFRWGFDISKPLQSKPPSAAAIASFRQRYAAMQPTQAAPPQSELPPPPLPPGTAGPGSGSAGSFGGGRSGGGWPGGRLTFSLTHQLNLVDEVSIADGVPKLDYLHGEPVGQTGGRPRHEVQFETGYYNNGNGMRLQGSWRSATTVESSSGDLKFSPYFDVDLKLFSNLGENLELVSKHPFFRGASIRLDVDNMLNSRPRVRDANGNTPLSYQPDMLEPVGRTIGITFRKLFIPQRFFQPRREQRPIQ